MKRPSMFWALLATGLVFWSVLGIFVAARRGDDLGVVFYALGVLLWSFVAASDWDDYLEHRRKRAPAAPPAG